MCTVCGCGEDEVRIEGETHGRHHHHPHPEPSHDEVAQTGATRRLRLEQDILARNDQFAAANRRHFAERGILAINLLSSPGSGKTSLLTRSIGDLGGELPLAVIEGDQQTSNDAERIRACGVPALQINTGKGCHLDAHMIGHALQALQPAEEGVLFIENVGNLVCPAAFDLGEAQRVVILSVTEGDDKPLKYPDIFHKADLLLLNKIDLLPHVDFDVGRCIAHARRINPGVRVLRLSARSGEGLEAWYRWLRASRELARLGRWPE
ncbi:hydrogenase nickel incorporation protein HypB [Thiohalobacter sp. IOR34]|uniref:hydrogenase nickel incorporation protein HypB n=1 Tax=Thiohalobacter sp. IOR34 TaxID=3057176 RepID=UPI0025B0AD1E|nr:hydrogenase nickel incorporation protein HypB [Thiohalobacter sp. IOR34]WJW76390.1 hydrogenase nickel incorporation protein HypB [Thiohalobacter sp. IOR34]